MKLSLGIDIGSSSTKAAALDEHGTLLGTLQVHADDPRTSAYGVLGRFLDQQGASFDDVEKIVLTGLGSTYFHENIFGIPTIHALELDAIGRGGLYLSGLDEALVVSLGTGSAFIRASKTNGFRHLGGSGVGGGTLAGMAERFLGVTDIFALSEMALRGNKAMADLRIADVQEEDVPGLAADLTAANFGRIKSGASDADLAAALFNMIYENVGVMASLALSQDTTRNVVLTGSLASLAPAAKTFDIFNQMHDVFGIDYIIPRQSERFYVSLCRRTKITDGSQQIGGCDQGASCEDKKVSQIKDDLFQVFTPDAEIIYHITAFEAVIQVA